MDEKYIIKRQEIEAFSGRAKTHFLNDNAKRINKSLEDLAGLTAIGFHLIEVAPGHETTEFHRHYFEEECVYILQGEAESRIGDSIEQVKAGDFIGYRAGGAAHMLTNTGTEKLVCIVVGQRLAHDVADYPDKNRRIFRNAGMPWNLVDIAHIEEPQAGSK